MSFMLTKPQVLDRSKTVTRRLGWWHLIAEEVVRAVEKAMGLKKGEKVKSLAVIRVWGTRKEQLRRMTDDLAYGRAECILEGFPDLTPAEFVAMFCKSHRGCTPETYINRIEFTYPEELQS